jgi:acyl-CoA synthetase (AMP-forming)/AMP-acid ligase II
LEARALAVHGDRIALVAYDGQLSYRQLSHAISVTAGTLRALGVTAGDRVAIQLPNSCAAVVSLLATAQLGAVPAPVQVALKGEALRTLALDCEPRLAIGATAHLQAWPCKVVPPDKLVNLKVESSLADSPARSLQDLAALIYTSGSTGLPKGVMLSAANMTAALDAVHVYLRPSADDVYFSALPLSSSYGLYQMISALSLGARLVLDRSFSFPMHSLKLLATNQASIFAAVPTQVAWILGAPNFDAGLLQSLRIVTTAAAALPAEHAQRLQTLAPQARIYAMYGQTECKRISYLDPADLIRKSGSVGKGLAIQRHVVVDSQGARVQAGAPGELVVQGPHVMMGYWRDPARTAEKLKTVPGESGTWLYTGDFFREDSEGYLYFLGRADELLKIGGHKVSPAEIENVILQLPGVREVAVIGQPDEQWGQVAKAFVVLVEKAAVDRETIAHYCALKLPRYMVPKAVHFVAQLPKTESGKIRKQDLS